VTDLVIRPVRYESLVAQALVEDALADLAERYGGGDETPVDASEFQPPRGVFLVAFCEGRPVACGGWRSHGGDSAVAEIKRMFTRREARGAGVGRAVLAAVENSARGAGRVRIILETGQRQPEAIRLYQRAGYRRIRDFGFYRDEPDVLSFGKDL
jgi:GNAT superfamily N-acetyltransferase